MELSFTEKISIRRSFGKLKEILSIPNLIEVQKQSYNQFLSSKNVSEAKLQKGLVKVFKSFNCNIDVHDPWVNKDQATHEYNIQLIDKPIKFVFHISISSEVRLLLLFSK